MTDSADYSPFVALEASDAASTTAVGTRWQNSSSAFPWPFWFWRKARRAFDSVLVQPLKTRIRLVRDVALLSDMDDQELQDIGINRTDIVRIGAGIYKRDSSDSSEELASRRGEFDGPI